MVEFTLLETFKTDPTSAAWFCTKFRVVAACCTESSCRIKGDAVVDMVFPLIEIFVPAWSVFCFCASKVFKLLVSVYEAKALFRAVLVTYADKRVFIAAVSL